MLCPYCQLEYTAEQPCFCQPSAATRESPPDSEPEYTKPAEIQVTARTQDEGLTLLFT